MSGLFAISVQEARGFVAVPADLDNLAVVMGCSSLGSSLSSFFLSGSAAVASVGYGDAVDSLTQIIEQKQDSGNAVKFPAALCTTAGTTVGTYGAVDATGVTGTAVTTMDAASHPYGTYHARLRCVTGCLIGTTGGQFAWSLDNGENESVPFSLGTATSYTIPNSNVKFDFAPTTADLTALNTLINEIYTDFNAHVILTTGTVHGVADSADVVTIASATNTATRIARMNALRAAYQLHVQKTAGGVHGAADSADVLTSPVCTDDSTCLVLALEFKEKYNLHIPKTSGGVHGLADGTNVTTAAAPSAGAFIAGDIVKVRTKAPAPVGAEIDAAFATLAAASVDFGLLVLDFPVDAALLAHVSTGLSTLLAVGKRVTALARTRLPDFETSETDAAWNASIAADFATFTDSRICLRAAYELVTDAMTTRKYLRSDLAQFAADAVRVGRAAFPDVPADQPMANAKLVDASGNTIGHDEGTRGSSTGLSNDALGNRFSCAMRFPDYARRESVYCTVPWVLYAADERIRNLPTRRIANAMERVAVSAGIGGLGGHLFYIPADPGVPGSLPRLTPSSRAAIQSSMLQALQQEFSKDIQNATDGSLDTGLVQVNPIVTVSGGNLLSVAATLAPLVGGFLLNLGITLAVQE